MNFILDQEERVKQLEEYMKVIVADFMQLFLEVTGRLKEKIIEEGSRIRNIKKITKYPDIKVPEPLAMHKFSENPAIFFRDLQFYPYELTMDMFIQPSRIYPIFGRVPSALNRLHNRVCICLATRAVEEDNKAEEEAGGEAANEGARGPTKIYLNISQDDWQVRQARWTDQQDEQWEQFDASRGQKEAQANWMYDHTIREFQYLSTRDNLDPHLQIVPFPGCEADYPPYGYHGHMPPGFAYRPDPSHDGSS
ncbi:hypothetical protein Tco_0959299 [Tanacetum coccineum]